MSINTYLSVHDYLKESTGQETTSLLGNLMKIGTGGVVQGATSLPITPNTTVTLNQFDQVYIFDGSNSEIVTVSSTTASGASSIPISATQYAHAQAVSCCSDGRLGSIGELLIEGSAAVERVARQPLLQATYTDTLPLVSMRACVDNQNRLMLRPKQFPVTAITSIQLQFTASSTLTLDATQAIIKNSGKLISVPVVKSTSGGGAGYQLTQYLDPTTEGEVTITYTAGYVYSMLPPIIRRCAVWLTSDLLSDRANPDGAAETRMGEQQIVAYLRGDLTGESALVKRARRNLAPYTQEAW